MGETAVADWEKHKQKVCASGSWWEPCSMLGKTAAELQADETNLGSVAYILVIRNSGFSGQTFHSFPTGISGRKQAGLLKSLLGQASGSLQ